MEVIDESSEYGYIPDPPPPPIENKSGVYLSHREIDHNKHLAERQKIIRRNTLGDNDFSRCISYAHSVIVGSSDRERLDRKSAEKRTVIRRHSDGISQPSLANELNFAKSVLFEEGTDAAHEKKVVENRKVKKLVTRGWAGDGPEMDRGWAGKGKADNS